MLGLYFTIIITLSSFKHNIIILGKAVPHLWFIITVQESMLMWKLWQVFLFLRAFTKLLWSSSFCSNQLCKNSFFYKLLLSFYENCQRDHWSLWFGFFQLICSTSLWVFVQRLLRWIKFGFSIFSNLHLKKWNTISYHVEFFGLSSLQCFVSLICYFTKILAS